MEETVRFMNLTLPPGWLPAGVEAAAEGHEVMRIILLALVALHVLGALYQRLVLRSDVMTRMVKPG